MRKFKTALICTGYIALAVAGIALSLIVTSAIFGTNLPLWLKVWLVR